MLRTAALIACFALAPVAARGADAPPLTVPAEVKVDAATIGEVKAETAGEIVRWVVLTPGLSVRACDGGKTLLVSGNVGRYEVMCYTAVGNVPSHPARTVVVVGNPAPGPGPTPPPAPVDALKEKVRLAHAQDKASREDVLLLAELYRQAAKLSLSADVPSSRELLRRVREASLGVFDDRPALTAVRTVVASELAAALGKSNDDPLTEAERKRASDLFAKLAGILEELAK